MRRWIQVLGLDGRCWAQAVTGTISGTVADAQGQVVPGATVFSALCSWGDSPSARRMTE